MPDKRTYMCSVEIKPPGLIVVYDIEVECDT
jgi:hypothetical protein